MGKAKFDRTKPHVKRGNDRARRPREDDADVCDHNDAGEEVLEGTRFRSTTSTRHRRSGERGDHDRDGARGVRDGEPSLRARGLSWARGLREEHDHGRGSDGRGDPGGERSGRTDATDAGAHLAGTAGERAARGRVPEQGGHGRRRGAVGAGGVGGTGAVERVRFFRATTRR